MLVEVNDLVEIQPSPETHEKDLVFRRGQLVAKTANYGYVELDSAIVDVPLHLLKVVDK